MIILPSIVFHLYRPAAWLRVTGPDAETFLQGQFSNDLRPAKGGGTVYGLWLSHKGKILADSFVIGDGGAGFWLGSLFSPGATLRKHLEDHIIADDVTVEDLGDGWNGVALVGAGAGAWLESEPRAGLVFRGRRALAENWEWVYPTASAGEVAACLAGGKEGSATDLERLRIASGIPAVPADLGPGDLPQEGGLEAAAISHSKGCYLGQEVMARLRSGRVRRRLVRVEGRGPIPPLPTPLWQEGRRAGELRTAIGDPEGGGFMGLALVALPALQAGLPFSVAADQAPSVVAATFPEIS